MIPGVSAHCLPDPTASIFTGLQAGVNGQRLSGPWRTNRNHPETAGWPQTPRASSSREAVLTATAARHRLKASADLTPRKPKRVLWHEAEKAEGVGRRPPVPFPEKDPQSSPTAWLGQERGRRALEVGVGFAKRIRPQTQEPRLASQEDDFGCPLQNKASLTRRGHQSALTVSLNCVRAPPNSEHLVSTQ